MTKSVENPESDGDLILAPDERMKDHMNEVILLKINDLEYRVNDLELSNKSHPSKHPCTGKVARK